MIVKVGRESLPLSAADLKMRVICLACAAQREVRQAVGLNWNLMGRALSGTVRDGGRPLARIRFVGFCAKCDADLIPKEVQ